MSHAPSASLARRHEAVRQALVERSLDALVITSLPNILYLTNFTGSSAIVVLTRTHARALGLEQGVRVWVTPAAGAITVPNMASVG